MKPVHVHVPSALAGAALLGLVVVAVGAVQAGALPAPVAAAVAPAHVVIDNPISVVGVPAPSDMVQIAEGTPFIVPPGKVFVLTALGVSDEIGGIASVRFFIDGHAETAAQIAGGTLAGGPMVTPFPPGLSAGEGKTLTVGPIAGGIEARAWGYLAAP